MSTLATAPPTVTVEWVTPADSPAGARALASLQEWGEARGVRLAPPRDAPRPAITPDLSVGDAVEDHLQRARDGITALDGTVADSELGAATALLDAHPELPQASWLEAEVLRARAAQWRQLPPHDARRPADAWRRAAALDGGRARGVGDGTEGSSAEHTGPAAVLPRTTLSIEGLGASAGERASVLVTLDGVAVAPAAAGPNGWTLVGQEGEHQLRVLRRGALVWAGWVMLGSHSEVTTVTLPRPAECSADDLAQAHVARDRGPVAAVTGVGVACGDWAIVEDVSSADGAPAELAIARCNHDVCGPRLHWKVGVLGPVVPYSHEHGGRWPAWAKWTIVAGSAAVITAATLAAAGVFRPTHDEPVFTTGGLHVAATPLQIRFDSAGR